MQLDLRRNAEFYRSGLEETNSKMERLEELFNESVNSLKDVSFSPHLFLPRGERFVEIKARNSL